MSKILKIFKKDRADGASNPPATLCGPSDAPSAATPNQNSEESPAQAPASKPSQPVKKIGLLELAKGKGDERKTVDVVAVHGLQGDAYETWTHENGTMWLESIAPDKIPFDRIMTFG
jgi:hypothetical protein